MKDGSADEKPIVKEYPTYELAVREFDSQSRYPRVLFLRDTILKISQGSKWSAEKTVFDDWYSQPCYTNFQSGSGAGANLNSFFVYYAVAKHDGSQFAIHP